MFSLTILFLFFPVTWNLNYPQGRINSRTKNNGNFWHQRKTTIFFDNNYNYLELMEYLKQRHVLATGTARINRFVKAQFTDDIEMKNCARGSSESLICDNGVVKMFCQQSCISCIPLF